MSVNILTTLNRSTAVKAQNLHAIWSAADNSRLTAKQSSFRLPVHVAAKLAALSELYPNKTRTQLVGDLLAAALSDVEAAFPPVKGRLFDRDRETGEELFEDVGMHARYAELANKYFAELEKELGNDKPDHLVSSRLITNEDIGK